MDAIEIKKNTTCGITVDVTGVENLDGFTAILVVNTPGDKIKVEQKEISNNTVEFILTPTETNKEVGRHPMEIGITDGKHNYSLHTGVLSIEDTLLDYTLTPEAE